MYNFGTDTLPRSFIDLFYISLKWILFSAISNMGQVGNMSVMIEKIENKSGLYSFKTVTEEFYFI